MTTPPRPAPWLGWGLFAGSAVTTWVVMVAGPSAAEAPLPGSAPLVRSHLGLAPWAVAVLLTVAVITGTGALWLAVTGRWAPSPRRLLAAGLVVMAAYAVSPPIGSADPLSYAAYGRMVVLGHDPWTTTPRQLGDDPVARAVEPPWQDTPSVYGPLAAGEQALAARIAGPDPAAIVELLDAAGVVVLAAAGLLVAAAGRRAVAPLLLANPLVLIPAVAGGHIDTLVAGFAVAAVAAGWRADRNRPGGGTPAQSGNETGWWCLAGLCAGLAADVKATAVLIVAGLALAAGARRRPAAVAAVLGGAAAVLVPSYLLAGPGAWRELRRASHLVSAATPWRPVVDVLQLGVARDPARTAVGVLSVLLLVALAVALGRRLLAAGVAAPVALPTALLVGYVLAAAYVLPWYDAVAWAALAVVPLGIARVERVVAGHTAVLALAYLPGRAAVPLAEPLRGITDAWRAGVAPAVIAGLILWVLLTRSRATARRPAG